MDQIIPHLRGSHANISAHHVFAKEVNELNANRMFQIGHSPHMPRAVPVIVTVLGKVLKGFKVGRKKLIRIAVD